MPSKSQTARLNGAKSRGPVTEAGRTRSSQNALKHGLTAQTIVLPTEDPDEYDALLTSYLQQFQPDGPVELDLIHEMAAAQWRLQRVALIETQLFAAAIHREEETSRHPLTPIESLTAAFTTLAHGNSLAFLHRMESRLGRSYSRALRNLLQLQRLRHNPDAGPSNVPGENEICKNEPTGLPIDDPPPTSYLNAPSSPRGPEDRSDAPLAPSQPLAATPAPVRHSLTPSRRSSIVTRISSLPFTSQATMRSCRRSPLGGSHARSRRRRLRQPHRCRASRRKAELSLV